MNSAGSSTQRGRRDRRHPAAAPAPAARRGPVLIVGSVGGKMALPFAGPYHATKFALEALAVATAEALAIAELAGFDVVQIQAPSPRAPPVADSSPMARRQ